MARPSSLPVGTHLTVDRYPTARNLHELAERLWKFIPLSGFRVRQEALVNPKRFIAVQSNTNTAALSAVTSTNIQFPSAGIILNDGDALLIEDLEIFLVSAQANPAAGTAPALTLLAYTLTALTIPGNAMALAIPLVGPFIESATVGAPIFGGIGNLGGSVAIRLDKTVGAGIGFVITAEDVFNARLQIGQQPTYPVTVNPVFTPTIANSTAAGVNFTSAFSMVFRKFEGIESA